MSLIFVIHLPNNEVFVFGHFLLKLCIKVYVDLKFFKHVDNSLVSGIFGFLFVDLNSFVKLDVMGLFQEFLKLMGCLIDFESDRLNNFAFLNQ